MKIDISIIHFAAIIVLGVIAVVLVFTHQTTYLAAIIHFLLAGVGMTVVPAILKKKDSDEV